jgi:beta-lactamase regulating signal transducer with metallopeptidase domain
MSIADFYGWITIIGSLIGAIYVFKSRKLITAKYMKRLEKNKEPVEFLFSRTPTGDFRVSKKSDINKHNLIPTKKSTPISELKRI